MSGYLIILIILVILIVGLVNKVNCFDSFYNGAKNGFTITINMFSSLLTFTLAISLFLNCGIIEYLKNNINFDYPLILIQCIVRPMSSSSSLSIMNEIYNNEGVDSFMGILSTMIHYISDSSIYIIPFYCSYFKIKKYERILLFGIIINVISYLIAIIIVIIFYKLFL